MGRPTSERELTAFETLMVAGEDDPRTRSAFVVTFVFDQAPELASLIHAFDYLSRRVVRFRQKAVLPAVTVGTGRWAVDPDFDLSYHVRTARLPAPGSFRQVLDLVQLLMMAPLDRNRPLWEAHLLTGLGGGDSGLAGGATDPDGEDTAAAGGNGGERAALVVKIHHAMFDGLGGLYALVHLFQTDRAAPPPALLPRPGPSDLDPTRVALDELRGLPLNVAEEVSRGATAIGRALLGAGRNPGGLRVAAGRWGQEVGRWGQALGEFLRPPPSGGSPLLVGRSARRRVLTFDVGVDELKAAGKAAGGSLNDAYLAAVAGALGAYHRRLGHPLEVVSLAMPVSLRAASDEGASNQWSPVRLAAPAAEADPLRRIARIRELTTAARGRARLDAVGRLSPLMTFVPRWALGGLSSVATSSDVQVSNVPGWDGGDLWLAGARIAAVYPFGPLPGAAAMVTLFSYNGQCHLGVTYDPAAVLDAPVFAAALQAGFDEVAAVGRRARPGPAGAPNGAAGMAATADAPTNGSVPRPGRPEPLRPGPSGEQQKGSGS